MYVIRWRAEIMIYSNVIRTPFKKNVFNVTYNQQKLE